MTNLNAAAPLVHQPVKSDLKQLVVPFDSVVDLFHEKVRNMIWFYPAT